MAIRYYTKGEHPGGFVGFHVSTANGHRQEYFSTNHIADPTDDNDDFKLQRLLAERQQLDWQIEELEAHYHAVVTTSDPEAMPYRGVGVHGITAEFAPAGKDLWKPCFIVACKDSGEHRRFTFVRRYYSKAWEAAVRFWATEHNIRKEDRDRVIAAIPPAEQFKDLRRHMNEEEGFDIPIPALSTVFREQRDLLADMSKAATTPSPPVATDAFVVLETERDHLADEMADWFKKALSETGSASSQAR